MTVMSPATNPPPARVAISLAAAPPALSASHSSRPFEV
jgi:hypothetical protein